MNDNKNLDYIYRADCYVRDMNAALNEIEDLIRLESHCLPEIVETLLKENVQRVRNLAYGARINLGLPLGIDRRDPMQWTLTTNDQDSNYFYPIEPDEQQEAVNEGNVSKSA